jgi:hypothetical protein
MLVTATVIVMIVSVMIVSVMIVSVMILSVVIATVVVTMRLHEEPILNPSLPPLTKLFGIFE